MDTVDIIKGGSMVIGLDGRIVAVGPHDEIDAKYGKSTFKHRIDARGKAVVPGLVDGHTHPVWAGDRVNEFRMKLAGATYMDIHKMGGGIGFTVRHTHAASEDELLQSFLQRLDRMLACGTTLTEAKSGYGLDLENEVKMLKVIHRAKSLHPVEVVGNYCGAHSVPKGKSAREQTHDVVDKQLPVIRKLMQQGVISPELIDVFCEKGVFEIEDTREILKAGMAAGLAINFHGDELSAIRAAELAAELNALAISHLEHISDEGIKQMATKGVIATLLPTTAYVLRIAPPPARKIIDGNVAVALGSDFNPNAHCLSLPLTMNLACILMKMTMNEALVAATLNSAASLRRADDYGSLEVGKYGDFILLSTTPWEHLIYEMVDPPIESVFKKGDCVYTKPKISLAKSLSNKRVIQSKL